MLWFREQKMCAAILAAILLQQSAATSEPETLELISQVSPTLSQRCCDDHFLTRLLFDTVLRSASYRSAQPNTSSKTSSRQPFS